MRSLTALREQIEAAHRALVFVELHAGAGDVFAGSVELYNVQAHAALAADLAERVGRVLREADHRKRMRTWRSRPHFTDDGRADFGAAEPTTGAPA